LSELKRKFGRGDDELAKITELKRVEQKEKMIEEFVQEFRRATRKSRYEKRTLV